MLNETESAEDRFLRADRVRPGGERRGRAIVAGPGQNRWMAAANGRSILKRLGFRRRWLIPFGVLLVISGGAAWAGWGEGELLGRMLPALALSVPLAIAAHSGHLDFNRQQGLSPAGVLFLVWVIGLSVPIIAGGLSPLMPRADPGLTILLARFFLIGWFLCFAVVLRFMKANRESLAGRQKQEMRTSTAWADYGLDSVALLAIWATGAVVASRQGVLSNWEVGPAMSAYDSYGLQVFVFLYRSLTPTLAPIGVRGICSSRVSQRLLGWILLLAGAGGLVLLSSRRLILLSGLASLVILWQAGGRVHVKRELVVLLVAWLFIVPLTSSIRIVLKENVEEGAGRILLGAFDRPWFGTGEDSLVGGGQRQLISRWSLGEVFFDVSQHVLANGPNWSPSPLSGLLRSVPIIFWSEKNELSDLLDFKQQLYQTGRFPPFDLPTPAPQESLFQLGFIIGPLGGAIYGLIAGILARTAPGARTRVPGILVWSACFVAAGMFDCPLSSVFDGLRDASFLAGGLVLLRALRRIASRNATGHGVA